MKLTNKMSRKIGICAVLFAGLFLIAFFAEAIAKEHIRANRYPILQKDESASEPLAHLNEEYYADSLFSSNLPLVVMSLENEPSIYKSFSKGKEIVDESVNPWVKGTLEIIDVADRRAYLKDAPSQSISICAKRRGHTSMAFDKPQFYLKSEETHSLLNMGDGKRWVLCGSMADKSMLRNYLAYRVAWELGGSAFAPECRFCEVFLRETNGKAKYMGVYLLQSAVSQGVNQIDIPEYNPKNHYSSYILRRDRYTNFDTMLETYGRANGFTDTWIGIKYPTSGKLNEEIISYIENDFSSIERVIYSDSPDVFLTYPKYINRNSFIDYFLLNEFFGNYDAGLHSTYYYKTPGGKLNIGPVWDFDQAMNNYYEEEMNPESIAFQTRTFYSELVKDRAFVKDLKKRFAVLRRHFLSERYLSMLIDEAVRYLNSARVREWYRWKDDYESADRNGGKNYVLKPYVMDGEVLTRFNTDYEQEIRIIKVYLTRHGAYIQESLSNLLREANVDSSMSSHGELFFYLSFLALILTGIFVLRRI